LHNRVLTVHREFVHDGENSYWSLAVEYLAGEGKKPGNRPASQEKTGSITRRFFLPTILPYSQSCGNGAKIRPVRMVCRCLPYSVMSSYMYLGSCPKTLAISEDVYDFKNPYFPKFPNRTKAPSMRRWFLTINKRDSGKINNLKCSICCSFPEIILDF
jgi:hypothetical protein